GTVLAAAEAPRRIAERRGRGQAQGAVAAEARQPVAVAEPAPASSRITETDAAVPTPSAPEEAATLFADLPPARAGIGADPFQALPMTVASRPWPRAATASASGYTVGLGNATAATAPAWPVQSGPPRQAVAELFGLPPEAGPRLPVATAIGAHAVGADDAPPAPVVLHPGPR